MSSLEQLYEVDRKVITVNVGEVSELEWGRKDTRRTPKEFADALLKAADGPKSKGCTELWVTIETEIDHAGYGSAHFVIKGKRPETNEEYQSRLKTHLVRMKMNREDYERKRKYYEENGRGVREENAHVERIEKVVSELQDALDAAKQTAKVKELEKQLQTTKEKLNQAKQGG